LNFWLIVTATLVACEFILLLPFKKKFLGIVINSKKAKSVLLSKKISDNWKEKVLPVYAIKIFTASFSLLFLIFICLTPFAVICLLSFSGYSIFLKTLSSPEVTFGITGISMVYIFLRRKLQ